MSLKIDDSDLREILHIQTETRSGQYICDCPFCGKESHFYINKHTQMWDCKKCGEFGNIYKLLSYVGKLYLLGGSTIKQVEKIDSIRSISEQSDSDVVELQDLPIVKMPVGWKVSKNSTPYLLSRGITKQDCVRYNIGATMLMPKFKDYVIVPIYDGGEIRGFIGRYGNKRVPEGKLRYNNSIGTEFAELLFGYDEIVEGKTETVIIVEGIFDKMSVDKHLDLWDGDTIKCVSTFGKKISEQQIEKLKRKGVAKVILLYDYDAIKDTKKIGLLLQQTFITGITFTTKKDIDECTRDEALKVFSNVRTPDEFNSDVIGKLKR